MSSHSRRRLGRTLLLLAVFILFVATGAGVLDLSGTHLGIDFTPPRLGHDFSLALLTSREFVCLAVVGSVLCVLLPMLSPILASLLTLLGMLPPAYLGYTSTAPSTLLPMEFSLLTILMLFAVNMLMSYYSETATKQRLVSVFGQYVPPELARMINEDPSSLSLEGEAREMTVMFCDIRDFTGISEQLDPRQVVDLLNTLFTPLTRIIHHHLGTVDKYLGDGIMAFWGAPARDPYHAQHAVVSALEMQRSLVSLQRELKAKGQPEVAVGIGIGTGVMNVGNMGSEYRVAYTVVGDTVNLASRLETLTRNFGTPIVVSEAVREACPEIVFRELGTVKVKGKNSVTKVYEPICMAGELTADRREKLDAHRLALESFYHRRWDEAVARFGRLWESNHPDNKLYELYLQNIARFTEGPRPVDWQGELDLRPDPLFHESWLRRN